MRQAQEKRYVSESKRSDGLSLYCYSKSCVYDSAWNDFTLLARGLVVDHKNETVVATPFPKFFNAFEKDQTIPDLPFEVFDKVDGSLIILFWHDEWIATTKGSFYSTQGKQAHRLLGPVDKLRQDNTYLLEYVAPENRIVVGYPEPKLHLLSAFCRDGIEFDYDTLQMVAEFMGWEIVARRQFETFSDIIAHTRGLPASQEGHVVRFENGLRLKIKGEEYCRIHSLISGATPLGIWDIMRAGGDLTEMRRQLPEEFWYDLDSIKRLLEEQLECKIEEIRREAEKVAGLTDKEVGLRLDELPESVRRFIFPYRKTDGQLINRYREALFREIRPTANQLNGYVPSFSMNRLAEESL